MRHIPRRANSMDCSSPSLLWVASSASVSSDQTRKSSHRSSHRGPSSFPAAAPRTAYDKSEAVQWICLAPRWVVARVVHLLGETTVRHDVSISNQWDVSITMSRLPCQAPTWDSDSSIRGMQQLSLANNIPELGKCETTVKELLEDMTALR